MRVIERRNIDHTQLLQLAKMLLLLVEPQEPPLELPAMAQLKKEVMLVKDLVKSILSGAKPWSAHGSILMYVSQLRR
jgi:hypothetical protein